MFTRWKTRAHHTLAGGSFRQIGPSDELGTPDFSDFIPQLFVVDFRDVMIFME